MGPAVAGRRGNRSCASAQSTAMEIRIVARSSRVSRETRGLVGPGSPIPACYRMVGSRTVTLHHRGNGENGEKTL